MGDNDDGSSSSDEDYLTLNDSNTDRESLVRKKLLENFYGKSAVAAARPVGIGEAASGSEDDEDDNNDSAAHHSRYYKTGKDDIDSPSFDSVAHNQRHILHSSVHDLLEVEERLALQVRTLDSTMQALVYENYSRFIDATDAIRSIGVNVQANEAGLKKLSGRINSVDMISKDTEDELGALRDQVAEKIRVKRLLSRLDALLKLPQTLEAQIAAGKYRTATRSYISASTILGKHSQGFESLRNIETECTKILRDMKSLLIRKLMHWNGRLRTDLDYDAIQDNIPQPPKNMTEIFECVGTLHILLQDETIDLTQGLKDDAATENDMESERLEKTELQSMALGAATRALDRILDGHMIQVQDRRFALIGDDIASSPTMPGLSSPSLSLKFASDGSTKADGISAAPHQQPEGAIFVPREFLDAILEVATLYGMSFPENEQVDLLMDFISEAFSSFLSHVRSVLLEQSGQIKNDDPEEKLADSILQTSSADDASSEEEEISNALTLLVHAVREMAAGLSLPEVGVNADFAAGLVDEAMQLADTMVTRRVHQKFNDLRVKIVKDCLVPFALKLVEQQANTTEGAVVDKEKIAKARAVASTTLSDCLQLVDDTIRSILSGSNSTTSGTLGDEKNEATIQSSENLPAVVKEAVQDSTKEFTDWLASALEVLAGGEASNTNLVVEVGPDGEDQNGRAGEMTSKAVTSSIERSTSFVYNDGFTGIKDSESIMELIKSARLELRGSQDGSGVEIAFIIAIAEMCRLAQGSLSENLEQSMASHLGTSKRRSRHMFVGGDQMLQANKNRSEEDEVSLRFRLAASRVFSLYTARKGVEAASLLISGIGNLSEEVLSCDSPRQKTCLVLGTVKTMAMECSYIFDGPSRAGPVPVLDDGVFGGYSTSSIGYGLKSSLQIDVERIFKGKLSIHLHPSEQLDFSRSALIFCTMKVAFRALLECIRVHAFSASGFKQLQVDVEFLKLMLPHYIDEDFALQGNNACTSLSNLLADVMEAVGERCLDETCENDENLKHESLSILRNFMSRVTEDSSGIGSRFIIAENG
ncbi:hypothetical protein ACA910_004133 [Epithemia clementina (nom. ined.)]